MDYLPLLPGVVATQQRRARLYRLYRDYDDGKHRLKFATPDFERKYGQHLGELRENLCPGVISAFTDRLHVETWGSSEDAQATALTEGLTRLVSLVDAEAWRCGDAYVLVWPGPDGTPTPHFHRADEIVPHVHPDNPAILDWAAKVWVDGQLRGRINVYDAEGVTRFATAPLPADSDTTALPTDPAAWAAYSDDEAGDYIPHDFGATPVAWWKLGAVDQRGCGASILRDVIPLQDALNKSLADLVVAGEAYSRPLRYLLNYKPEATNPLAAAGEYMQAAAKVIAGSVKRRFDPTRQQIFTHDGGGPFGQLDPADLTKILATQDAYALKASRIVGIPPYYLTPTASDVPSGESLRVLTARLAARVRAYQRDNTPVLRGLAQLLGVENPVITWAPPQEIDILELWQVAQIKQDLGLAMRDVLDGLGIADLDDVVERAATQRAASAEAAGRALAAGEIPAVY